MFTKNIVRVVWDDLNDSQAAGDGMLPLFRPSDSAAP